MNTLDLWAAKWGIPPHAIADLRAMYVADTLPAQETDNPKDSEAYVQSECRLAAPRHGMLLFRNNVGALVDDRGVPLRYGLANDSKKLNEKIKSADLIGILRVLVTPQMVGTTLGVFASVECKKRYWQPGEDAKREAAQTEWANLVSTWGGYARITSSVQGML